VEMQCWPQDLYRIGDYDSDEGELWDNGLEDEANSDDSWETGKVNYSMQQNSIQCCFLIN